MRHAFLSTIQWASTQLDTEAQSGAPSFKYLLVVTVQSPEPKNGIGMLSVSKLTKLQHYLVTARKDNPLKHKPNTGHSLGCCVNRIIKNLYCKNGLPESLISERINLKFHRLRIFLLLPPSINIQLCCAWKKNKSENVAYLIIYISVSKDYQYTSV